MRLRHIMTATYEHDFESVMDKYKKIFGAEVTFSDPEAAAYGTFSSVFPIGNEFIEVMHPTGPGAAHARFLERRGGPSGYMIVLQVPDSRPHRARLKERGIRVIAEHDHFYYSFTQLHPRDFDGVMMSVDSSNNVEDWLQPDGHWYAGGVDWQKKRRHPNILGIDAVAVQSPDPVDTASRWGDLFQVPIRVRGNMPYLELTKGEVRFVPPVDPRASGIVSLEVGVRDSAPVLAAAEANGLQVRDNGFDLCGVRMDIVSRS